MRSPSKYFGESNCRGRGRRLKPDSEIVSACGLRNNATTSEENGIELEQMDSTDTSLAVYCLLGGRCSIKQKGSPEQVYEQAGPIGGIRARLTVFHRSVPVRSAIRREVA